MSSSKDTNVSGKELIKKTVMGKILQEQCYICIPKSQGHEFGKGKRFGNSKLFTHFGDRTQLSSSTVRVDG